MRRGAIRKPSSGHARMPPSAPRSPRNEQYGLGCDVPNERPAADAAHRQRWGRAVRDEESRASGSGAHEGKDGRPLPGEDIPVLGREGLDDRPKEMSRPMDAYLLRNIPDDLWHKVKVRATTEKL